jgi:antitoxin component of MazEF toxin-antitoxin module
VNIGGSFYSPIPAWIAQGYNIKTEDEIEYEIGDPKVLIIKIEKRNL